MTLPKDPIKANEYRERQRMIRLGKTASDATKQKMSASRSGENNPNYGKKMPEDQKDKIRVKKTGVLPTIETKTKMTLSQKKRYENKPELKTILSEAMTGERNHNFGKPMSEEQKKILSLAKQGENHWIYGKHHSPETREKIRVANSGSNCYHYGQSPSDETRRKMSEALKGDKCYNWKGGITELNHAIRTCLEYREWILAVFKRDDFTCQDCGATKVYLHAHHLKLFSQIMQENSITTLEEALACAELWDIANGRSLCEECHWKEHFGVEEKERGLLDDTMKTEVAALTSSIA